MTAWGAYGYVRRSRLFLTVAAPAPFVPACPCRWLQVICGDSQVPTATITLLNKEDNQEVTVAATGTGRWRRRPWRRCPFPFPSAFPVSCPGHFPSLHAFKVPCFSFSSSPFSRCMAIVLQVSHLHVLAASPLPLFHLTFPFPIDLQVPWTRLTWP